jgi:hypothetical protein
MRLQSDKGRFMVECNFDMHEERKDGERGKTTRMNAIIQLKKKVVYHVTRPFPANCGQLFLIKSSLSVHEMKK